ncbi:MAG TPA: TIGR01777 family oxidoreductase [Pseudonocardiaceae bacterium]|nr:TIGR01777 family oxidoreductase [Pseudonocardiaceae bacterium]
MRIVIAGSSGLIGTALVAELRKADHEVTRLVRRAPAGPDERGWDPPAGRLAEDALAGVDAVVNLCGVGIADKRWTEARKQALRDSRNTPTEVLAAAVAEQHVGTLVNASAIGFYGDTGDRTITENDPNGTGFLAEICRDWEAATTAAADAGARVVRLRTGLVLSPRGGLLASLRPLFQFWLGGRMGPGTQYWPWISLADEVAAIRFVLEHGEIAGPVNLTGPEPVTNAEFTSALAGVLGRPAVLAVPGFALRLVLGEQLVDEGILGGQRALPAVLDEAGFSFRHPTVTVALTAALRP